MEQQVTIDPHATWVYGKVVPGWYIARWVWSDWYADHLRSMGYTVERSIEKPKGKP